MKQIPLCAGFYERYFAATPATSRTHTRATPDTEMNEMASGQCHHAHLSLSLSHFCSLFLFSRCLRRDSITFASCPDSSQPKTKTNCAFLEFSIAAHESSPILHGFVWSRFETVIFEICTIKWIQRENALWHVCVAVANLCRARVIAADIAFTHSVHRPNGKEQWEGQRHRSATGVPSTK